jgi:hypothetical protein
MGPIKTEGFVSQRDAERGTQMIKEAYVDKIVYIESVEPLQQREMVHVTWTVVITWHKTGNISGMFIGSTPLDMRIIEHKNPPRFGLRQMSTVIRQHLNGLHLVHNFFTSVTRSLFPPLMATDECLLLSPPPARPTVEVIKCDGQRYWVKVNDMEATNPPNITASGADSATRAIRDLYIRKIVYLELSEGLQPRIIVHHVVTALMIWYKTGYQSGLGLRIGKTPIDLEAIEPKPLYDRPFTLAEIPRCNVAGASLILIPTEEFDSQRRIFLADRSMSDNVELVTLRGRFMDIPSGTWIIHKKMTPDTSPKDMIAEANTYITLRGCKYTPRLLGVTGDPATGECRGLLIEYIMGQRLCPMPLMYNNMRLQVTMNLLKAMEEIEERGIYLQDPNPDNIILTVNDGIYIVD